MRCQLKIDALETQKEKIRLEIVAIEAEWSDLSMQMDVDE
jgi:hypothetical protein